MNLPNKITTGRMVLSIIILAILTIPWASLGIEIPNVIIFGINANLLYLISGVLFMIASITDFIDGYLARKNNQVTDFGKVMDAIADKMLVNGLLVILAATNYISLAIPVIIITRDIMVDSIKMVSGSKGKVVAASWMGKVKTSFMMAGVTLVLFYNLPFELLGIRVDQICVIIATILSITSGFQYYMGNKDTLFKDK